jgi:hypothetical protein
LHKRNAHSFAKVTYIYDFGKDSIETIEFALFNVFIIKLVVLVLVVLVVVVVLMPKCLILLINFPSTTNTTTDQR